MLIKPIDLDEDNSDQESKLFRTVIIPHDNDSLKSEESIKKDKSFESSEKELSPLKYNKFNYDKLKKVIGPISVNDDDDSCEKLGIPLDVVEDTKGIDTQ